VGTDNITGSLRFTFGILHLSDGFDLVPLVMGLFGISEVLINVEQTISQDVLKTKIKNLLPTAEDWKKAAGPVLRGTGIGFFLGVLPGAGPVISSFVSYTVEKRISRHPEKFGTGMIEGVAGPESANNAATMGAMVPLLTFGIPSNVVMALFLAALMIHGTPPGPLLIQKHPELFWGTIASMYIGNGMLVILNLPLIGIWVQVLKVPYTILFPLILLFCFLGVYSLNNNMYEIVIMIIFGVFGYLTQKFGFEGAPFLLAMVLGPMMEANYRRSFVYGDPLIFFKRPISAFFVFASLVLLFTALFPNIMGKRKKLEVFKDYKP
jgi:putative tricarboxylic transport membrane protein